MKSDSFIEEIENFIDEHSISRNYLARMSGITFSGLKNILEGKHSAKQETIEKIRSAMISIANPIGEFGRWLQSEREKQGISVKALSDESGISVVGIYNIENGSTQNPTQKTREKIEKALKTKVPEQIIELDNQENAIEGLGSLKGVVNPHEKEEFPARQGVYVFYDVADRPLYIGRSKNIRKRVAQHQDRKWFIPQIVHSAAYIEIDDEKLTIQLEELLIRFMKKNAIINRRLVDRDMEDGE